MRFGSEIEARDCAKCGERKPLDSFHRHPEGPNGRHSWCGQCANAAQKASRAKHGRPPRKPAWNLKTRYGLTPDDVDRMLTDQGGVCAICQGEMKRQCVDHDHATGKVRGLLCHRCNIGLPYVERADYRSAALAYLERSK